MQIVYIYIFPYPNNLQRLTSYEDIKNKSYKIRQHRTQKFT